MAEPTVPIWCPLCNGALTVEEGEIRLNLAPNPVGQAFICCTACPFASQVENVTGDLIDAPGWNLQDLKQQPLEEFLPERRALRLSVVRKES